MRCSRYQTRAVKCILYKYINCDQFNRYFIINCEAENNTREYNGIYNSNFQFKKESKHYKHKKRGMQNNYKI